ncbi:hypothetical protein BaRGS_00007574 [Batillaria attramentaria]|uniref:Uncharacterized protein n=1 Tax=Batillaria attramentaria TaxID=370345 RepID=A0ABD0LNP7_9CAEN
MTVFCVKRRKCLLSFCVPERSGLSVSIIKRVSHLCPSKEWFICPLTIFSVRLKECYHSVFTSRIGMLAISLCLQNGPAYMNFTCNGGSAAVECQPEETVYLSTNMSLCPPAEMLCLSAGCVRRRECFVSFCVDQQEWSLCPLTVLCVQLKECCHYVSTSRSGLLIH